MPGDHRRKSAILTDVEYATRSAPTVNPAKSLGVMNLAFLPCKSSSEIPRAFAQAPQAQT